MTEIEQRPCSRDFYNKQPPENRKYFKVEEEEPIKILKTIPDLDQWNRPVTFVNGGALQSVSRVGKEQARPIGLPKPSNPPVLPSMTEQELQDSIIDLAQRLGWRVHAERAAWTSKGYRTPIQGDAGFVDLVLAKPGRPLIFAECKSDKGRLSPEQLNWGQVLAGATHCYYFVWRPSDWMNDSIKKILEVV